MALIATTISDTTVHMRYADNPDPAKAEGWLDFQVPINALSFADENGEHALGNPNHRYLGTIRVAALRHARGLLDDEIRNLSVR